MSHHESQTDLDIQRVVAVTDEEANAISASDLQGYLATLAEDAVFMPPDLLAKRGDELRGWLRDFLQGFQAEWLKYVHDETVVEGCLAYHRYSYRWRVSPKAGGESVVSQGKGIHVLRRQPDGSWKIVVNMWNATP
jgi:ketosteroid isomerase-like protein